MKSSRPRSTLVGARTSAKRETALLRRARTRLESQDRPNDTSARSSLLGRRSGSV
ncbi:MAG TPA: hypothetical protein VIM71_02640 [Lacunisphaera sp.]